MRTIRVVAMALATAAAAASCVSVRTREKAPPHRAPPPAPAVVDTAPREYPGLHNVVAFHDGFWSGGVPGGAAGFDTLAALGVRTVISVDGAAPDVAAARARGMRYIHLPIGYNGMDEQRKLELVRATRDAMAQGPVYIHCHHGKHRSAGAAGAVVASLGWATPQEMIGRMQVSGTSPSYTGLYACTAAAAVIGVAEIDAVHADFPEVARTTEFVQGMVEIEAAFENLRAVESAGWTVPKDHPDLVPAAEAGRLVDLLRILREGERVKSEPETFTALMKENEARAQALEDLLAAGERDAGRLSGAFKLVGASCRECHAKHRD